MKYKNLYIYAFLFIATQSAMSMDNFEEFFLNSFYPLCEAEPIPDLFSLHLPDRLSEQLLPEPRSDKQKKPCTYNACNVSTNLAQNLKTHMKQHETGAHVCPYPRCGYTGTRKDRLENHIRKHHEQLLTLAATDRPSEQLLMPIAENIVSHVHKKTKTNSLSIYPETPPQKKPFACESCTFSTNFKQNLDSHKRIHTGEKPYACPYKGCYKCFNQTGNLKIHMKGHGIGAHVCPHCGYTTARPDRLKKHISKNHEQLPTPAAKELINS